MCWHRVGLRSGHSTVTAVLSIKSKFCLLSCFCTFNNRLFHEKGCAGILTKVCE